MKRMVCLAAGLLSACATVGPDYRGAPVVAPRAEAGGAFVHAEALPATGPVLFEWWHALGDPQLDQLIATARDANKDLATARARLRQARAQLREARAASGPDGGGKLSVTRTRPSIATFGIDPAEIPVSDQTLYEASLDASWELDLFGGQRRGREAARAEAAAADYGVGDALVSVTAETALAYFAYRDAQARLALAEANRRTAGELGRLAAVGHRAGAVSGAEVARAGTLTASAAAERASILAELAAAEASLAVLTGREPGALSAELAATRPLPTVPAQVAIGDPAGMLRRRPDIRAAERRVAGASARIGVATADLFPKVTLTGMLGLITPSLGALGSQAFTYSAGPQLRWNFLGLGRAQAQVEQARGVRDERLADYEKQVLDALKDAESALARFNRGAEETVAREQALAGGTRAVELATLRRRAGAGTLEEVVNAERDRLDLERAAQAARLQRAESYVRLMKALGLGWRS